MIKHPMFHVEPWSLREVALDLDVLAQAESVFALSNGHIGWRGNLDEGEPHGLPGSYLNGVYESRPLASAEAAYGLPGLDGMVKAAMHHGSEKADPDAGLAPASADEVDEMRQWLEVHLPALAAGGWLGAKPCLYTLTPDEHFVLGRHPEHDRVAVACGFSGHGFKFAPVVGQILADLALDGHTRHDVALFDPARFASQVVD